MGAVEEEMEGQWRGYYRAHDACNREYAKWERYCQHQREILRELEDLRASERQMYELDDGKDQVMTVLKLALAILAMWARDRFFPPEYAHSTWKRLLPFFRLPGRVVWGTGNVHVDVRTFNDRGLHRDLVAVCDRVARFQPRLPDGETLSVSTDNDRHVRSDAQVQRVA